MTRLYKLSHNALVPVPSGRLANEKMVQDWIEQQPNLLGLDLLIIGREVATSYGGSIDLLGMDNEGDLTILELKRDRTPRDVIAQVLDYASWVATLRTREVHDIALRYLKKSLELAFQDRFKTTLPETLNENHTMMIIASAFDASSERIVRYLSEKHDVAINSAFFAVFEDAGQILLTTNLLLDQSDVAARSEAKVKVTTAELLALAAGRSVSELVEICRKLSSAAEEKPALAYGGSLRYWSKGKMIFGVTVAGGRRRPPIGQLDVWIPVTKLVETVAVPEEKIRATLKEDFEATESGVTDCIVGLKSPEEAHKLVALIREWVTGPADPSKINSAPSQS